MFFNKYIGYIISVLAVATTINHLSPSIINNPAIYGSIVMLLGLLIGFVVNNHFVALYNKNNDLSRKYKIISLILGILFVLAIPINSSQYVTLAINSLGDKNVDSLGAEVWIKEVSVDGRIIDLDSLSYTGQWENINDVPVNYNGEPASAKWEGEVKNNISVILGNHPYSGRAEITVNKETELLDLYSSDDKTFIYTYKSQAAVSWKLVLFTAIDIFIAYVMIYLLINNIKPNKTYNCINRRLYIICTIPLILTSLLAFFVYYPGLMSLDSLDQWRQLSAFDFNDAHPIFDTFIKYLLTRIWYSPAMIVISQIIFLVSVWYYGVKSLHRVGVGEKILFIISIVFSILPVNFMFSISLWKDIPYSISVLLLSIILINIYDKGATWFDDKKNYLLLGLCLLLILIFRHNGIIPVYGTAFFLFVMYKKRTKIILITLAVTCLFFGGKYATNVILDSPKSPSILTMSLPVQQVAAMLSDNVNFSSEEIEIIDRAMDHNLWSDLYNPYVVDPIIFNENFNMHIFDAPNYKSEFIKVWLSGVLKKPMISLESWLQQTSIIWRLSEPDDGSTLFAERGISKTGIEMLDKLNLKTNSIFPELLDDYNRYLDRSQEKEVAWFLWRPALYIFVTLLSMAVLIARRNYRSLIIFVPVMLNVCALFIAIPAQQIRYLYSSILFGFIAIALLFAKLDVSDRRNE